METILIIDDDDGLIYFLSRFFSRKGYDVKTCSEGRTALAMIAEEPFDLILLDYKIPELNGLETLKEIKKSQVKTPVVIMTAYGTTETAIEAMKLGAYDYLLKPFDRGELSRIVHDALIVNRQMKELVSYPDSATKINHHTPKGTLKIVGSCGKMQEVYKRIGQVAEKDISVLITGESGTGKELVAKAIYHHSHRKDKPFITVNCAAIPDSLFESELFGHERGAFTGADRTHVGKIERSNGGTLFLDEVGEMSVPTQAKLLRVLQEGEFERLGGNETLNADVRIIAATNRDISEDVGSGRFREDLYWRLKIISIHLPTLKNRIGDIPALVDYFTARFCDEYGKSVRYVSENAMRKLTAYSWPGNVRELENCIRRAVLLCSGDIILEEHLIQLESEREDPPATSERESPIENLRTKLEEVVSEIIRFSNQDGEIDVLELAEETIIKKAMEECGNNQVRAAKMLGISRNTLRHRVKKYGEPG